MRLPMFRALSALVLAGGISAGCGDGPVAAVPEQASFNTGSTLSVTMSCPDPRNYWTDSFDCTAVASGGSGTGYSFSWGGAASEYYDQGGTSKAWVPCQRYSGSYHGSLTAYAYVTDSNGNTGTGYYSRSC